MLQQAIHNELHSGGGFGDSPPPCVVSLVTQTVVDAADNAWTTSGTKAIGAWMTASEASAVAATCEHGSAVTVVGDDGVCITPRLCSCMHATHCTPRLCSCMHVTQ